MTNSPWTFREVRALFQQQTGLSAVALGIQHFEPQGGGYHEGNDLLSRGGRLHTDYSKRETELDRPGSDDASAIDIGRFAVYRRHHEGHMVLVDNALMVRWVLAEIAAGAPDTLWIREIIYSLDNRVVRRYDRLGVRSSGDFSHLSHEHFSAFRDMVLSASIPALFKRFWEYVNNGFRAPVAATATKRKAKSMFLIHKTLDGGAAQYALVGPDGIIREWKSTDVIDTPEGKLKGQDLANALAGCVGNSEVQTPAEYAAIRQTVSTVN